ncbi:MAG: response regulator [Thermodesulfobacteriota bacterium]
MRILIAEDDFVSRAVLQEMLAPFGVCHSAVDGREAVAAFAAALDRGEPYDLVCLDIMMPGLDGQEALREIRRLEAQRGIGGRALVKVVMTTALDDAKNIMQAFMQGHCEGYLVKPIDRKRLRDELARLGLIPPGAAGG